VRWPPAADVLSTTTPAQWQLVWHDEFEGCAIDRSKWDFELGNGFMDSWSGSWVPGWGNEELQCYTDTPGNLAVHDGLLHVRALRESVQGCQYTSARIRTRRADGAALFAGRYGRFEFRARAPVGKGLWSALWMLPQQQVYGPWPASGEIDVMEVVGDRPEQYLGSLHFGASYPRNHHITHSHRFADGSSVADFHLYSLEWEPGEIRWLVDDQLWARQGFWWSSSQRRGSRGLVPRSAADLNPWPAPFDQPFHIVINLAVGGRLPGEPDERTAFPAELQVDFVRVYTRDGGDAPLRPRQRGRFPYSRPRTARSNQPGEVSR